MKYKVGFLKKMLEKYPDDAVLILKRDKAVIQTNEEVLFPKKQVAVKQSETQAVQTHASEAQAGVQ